jgi:hypothetical protein
MARHHAGPLAFLLLCLVALSGGSGAFADGIVVPPAEAPTTIFSTKLGSADVDLSLLGSWTAGASFGGGFMIVPGIGLEKLDSFPSLDQGFVFQQTPDITIALTLMKKYFLNVSVLGDFSNNSIQLGYRGGPGEVVRSVVLGTQGITIPGSQLMQIPDQPKGSLGAMATLVSGSSTNNLLLRWDAAPRRTKTFIGKHELVEQEIGIDSYMKGRHFFLPDIAIDPNSLKVFLEDQGGIYIGNDGRKYRLATYDEVEQDSVLGLVYLRIVFRGRVVVYYTRGLAPVGTALGTPGLPDDSGGNRNPDMSKARTFSWGMGNYFSRPITNRQVILPGVGTALLLWEPGDISPFEIGSSYFFSSEPPADISQISIKLNPKVANGTLPTNVSFLNTPADRRFMALVDPNLASSTNRFYDFFPFPDPTGLLYGPNRDSMRGGLAFDIIYQFLTPVTDMILEADIVPGSVQMTVNGLPETRFQVDAASGRLTMITDVLPTDRIVVTYSKVEQGSSGGDILFAWTDRIAMSDAVNLSFGAGLRWNVNPWSYSQVAYSKSGTIIATAGIDGKTDNLAYSAQGAFSFTNPDTSGILRLFGMEGNLMPLDLSEDNAYPASVPDPTEPGMGLVSKLNRGFLFYRDFRVYDSFGGSSLQTFEQANPPQMPYANGKRMGPFSVQGSNGNLATNSLVFEYALNSGEWVGAQLPISSGSDVDLSSARAITLRLRNPNQTGSVNVYLQIGSISEDLDSTGVLKAEISSTDAGFPFVDQATLHSGITLKVGAGPQLTGNGRLDSEDRNANGLLDLEDATRVATPANGPSANPIALTAANAGWTNYTFTLADADRAQLLKARGIRIIIVDASGGSSGDILLDTITIEGTPFWPIPGGTDSRKNIQVQEAAENLAQSPPPAGGDLASRYPDTYRKFHSGGETNQVLETAWSSLTPTNTFTVQGFVPLVDSGTTQGPEIQGTGGIQYDTIVSYVRIPPPGGASYTFSLWDTTAASARISWTIPSVNDNVWHEIRVSKKENTVRMDGNVVGAPIKFDSGYGSLTQLQVQVTGAASGLLYIDEVYCTDPEINLGAALVGSLNAKLPGTLVKAGNVAILSDVDLREELSLMSEGFTPLYGTPSPAEEIGRAHV